MEKTEETLRTTALAWWNNLPVWGNPSKEYYIGLYYSDDTVTDERIEYIWSKRMQHISEKRTAEQHSYKSNQKQFTNFSEAHFWKYFNKFKHQDKVKMYELLKSWYEVEGNKTY